VLNRLAKHRQHPRVPPRLSTSAAITSRLRDNRIIRARKGDTERRTVINNAVSRASSAILNDSLSTFGRGLDLNLTVVINCEYRMNHRAEWREAKRQQRNEIPLSRWSAGRPADRTAVTFNRSENARGRKSISDREVIGINNPTSRRDSVDSQ